MSLLDGFFSNRFRAEKCKTLLKLTIPRIKLLRNRRDIHLKQMRNEIAKLLESGQEATARIRVEHIIQEEKMMAAQDIIELFSELIIVRLPIIEAQRECPIDLKEAISSLCFAAPRCSDLTELQQIPLLFSAKYGREFVIAATELTPDCGVNRQIIEFLSVRAPSGEQKLKLLKEIAEEHELDWDPSSTETELLKSHEDLLNGPSQFVSGTSLPLPETKHKDSQPDSNKSSKFTDETADFLDFPEVPNVPIRSNPAHSTTTYPAHTIPPDVTSGLNSDTTPSPNIINSSSKELLNGCDASLSKDSGSSLNELPKQFVPFISLPTPDPVLSKKPEPLSRPKTEFAPNLSAGKDPDLQGFLAAAQAAAETAERAASAARTAASLAQIRISELLGKRKDNVDQSTNHQEHGTIEEPGTPDGGEKFKLDSPNVPKEAPKFDNQEYLIDKPRQESDIFNAPSFDSPANESVTLDSLETHTEPRIPHQKPVRSFSMEDDTYFSYPNLFTSQKSADDEVIHPDVDIQSTSNTGSAH